jgi:hypothetical protein
LFKAKPAASFGRQAVVVFSRRLEQVVRSHDVRVDESRRTGDRTIDVTFGCEMNDRIWLVLPENSVHTRAVADVHLLERVGRLSGEGIQRAKIGGIGKLVNVDDGSLMTQHKATADR